MYFIHLDNHEIMGSDKKIFFLLVFGYKSFLRPTDLIVLFCYPNKNEVIFDLVLFVVNPS